VSIRAVATFAAGEVVNVELVGLHAAHPAAVEDESRVDARPHLLAYHDNAAVSRLACCFLGSRSL